MSDILISIANIATKVILHHILVKSKLFNFQFMKNII